MAFFITGKKKKEKKTDFCFLLFCPSFSVIRWRYIELKPFNSGHYHAGQVYRTLRVKLKSTTGKGACYISV